MDKNRWKRLREKGWHEGDAGEFLGLSPEEALYVEIKLRLADEVKARRLRRSLTQVELAERLGSSQSRVAKVEKGDPSVSLDLLMRSMLVLGATSAEIGDVIGAARILDVARPDTP